MLNSGAGLFWLHEVKKQIADVIISIYDRVNTSETFIHVSMNYFIDALLSKLQQTWHECMNEFASSHFKNSV